MQASTVENALEFLRPSLAADGFDLRVGSLEPTGTVQVVLEAKESACLECLVPDDLMVQMIEDAIRAEDPSLGRVELVKIGFETAQKHL